MYKLILSWDINKMFQVIERIIDKDENALVEYFGIDAYNRLLEYNGGDIDGALQWITEILKDNIESTLIMLHCIAKETKEINIVQARLKAIGIVKDSNNN